MGISAGKPRAPAAAARPFRLATVLVLASLAVLAFAGNSLIARYALAGGGIPPIAFSVVPLASTAIVLAPPLLAPASPCHSRARPALLPFVLILGLLTVLLVYFPGIALLLRDLAFR